MEADFLVQNSRTKCHEARVSRQQATVSKLRAGAIVLRAHFPSHLTAAGALLTVFGVAAIGWTKLHVSTAASSPCLQFCYSVRIGACNRNRRGMPATRATGTCRKTQRTRSSNFVGDRKPLPGCFSRLGEGEAGERHETVPLRGIWGIE